MKYRLKDYLTIIGAHTALFAVIYVLAGIAPPTAGVTAVYIHVLLSAVFCCICGSIWGGFAATVAMTILLWSHTITEILNVCNLYTLLLNWQLTLLAIVLAGVYSMTRYDRVQKLFAALRIELFFILLFGIIVFPALGIDAVGTWNSLRDSISNGIHSLFT